MVQMFDKSEHFFIKIFNSVGSLLKVNVEIDPNLFEQYSGVNFRFKGISNYAFRFEFQEKNYEKLMYGIRRENRSCQKKCLILEKTIKSNFCSHFCQSDEASEKSSFLVCATWRLYKYGFCKGRCKNRCFENEMCGLLNNLKSFFHANELTPWGFWKNDLNKDLLMAYKTLSSSNLNVSETSKQNLSCPMFIHLGLEYRCGEGVFIIGQETQNSGGKSGWGTPTSKFGSNYDGFENYIAKPSDLYSRESIMMETQSQWLFDKMQSRTTPFFKAVKEISCARNGADFYYKAKFVWNELVAMDYKGKSLENLDDEDEIREVIEYSRKKLIMDLLIAKPKYAIFFTGLTNFYKKALDQILNINDDVLLDYDNDIKFFYWKETKCFLTHHPRYLQTIGKWDVVTKLAGIINC